MSLPPTPDTLVQPVAPIPPRDPAADPRCVDLTAYYNHALDDDIHHKPGNTLSSLPKGLQRIDGTLFDLRGVVQLAGARSKEITTLTYPPAASAIPVGVAGHRIHFLHASAWVTDSKDPIGEYVVHFAGHAPQSVPLVYNLNIWDWWKNEGGTDGHPAWTGHNPRTLDRGLGIRLYKFTWENPFPNDTIRTIDFVSRIAESAPILVAITVE
jgi:hypothetical protein